MNREEYLKHLEFETTHRRRWLDKAVRNKRYIRGIITHTIKERINSRDKGQRTTDYEIRQAALAKTGGHCYLCWRKWNPELADQFPRLFFAHLQIDHLVPFSKFGPNHLGNYLPACSRCNNLKSDLSLGEFRAGVRKSWKR